MKQSWNYNNETLEINNVPFYWRLKSSVAQHNNIPSNMDFRFVLDEQFNYLKYIPTKNELDSIERAYKENANIGFLNEESGQLETYGKSSNDFLLTTVQKYNPKRILEIGCGAGYTILHLSKYGFDVIGIDPSEYSQKSSIKTGFKLINDFFPSGLDTNQKFDMIYCNDVFEHIFDVVSFSKNVFNVLDEDGMFCFSTTNSTQSILVGDISILEHQHVNMFTEESIIKILKEVGFKNIILSKGKYGNTLQVVAIRTEKQEKQNNTTFLTVKSKDFFEKAVENIQKFNHFYNKYDKIGFYVPLRCFGYLSTVSSQNDLIYDSNTSWHGKYIDGYNSPIMNPNEIDASKLDAIFVGSLTFYDEIKKNLTLKGIKNVTNITHL